MAGGTGVYLLCPWQHRDLWGPLHYHSKWHRPAKTQCSMDCVCPDHSRQWRASSQHSQQGSQGEITIYTFLFMTKVSWGSSLKMFYGVWEHCRGLEKKMLQFVYCLNILLSVFPLVSISHKRIQYLTEESTPLTTVPSKLRVRSL